MRRTKIVTTLGPASNNLEVLSQMVAAGVNVVRLNFSHGTSEEKKSLVDVIHQAAKDQGKTVGILADLQGPKIRVAKFKNGKVNLEENAIFTLDATFAKDAGDENTVGIDYKELPNDVSSGDTLLLNDGFIVLVVEKVVATRIICRVKVGGVLSNNKGINRQGGGLSAGALTDKDREDIKTAVLLGVDYIAISFVRSKTDVEETKDLIAKTGGHAQVIAKIERIEAVIPEILQEIIKASDGLMVARGDLAVEIGDAEVPAAQKMMIEYCRALNKPVITATQMMESMIHNMVPTRAEVSDVANAVFDGTDAVMLSAETASGEHPVVVVQAMDRICLAAEKQPHSLDKKDHYRPVFYDCTEAIAKAVVCIVNHFKVKIVVCLTETGTTALLVSRMRLGTPIYGFSNNRVALGRMTLYRDVYPIEFDILKFKNNIEIKKAVIEKLLQLNLVQSRDLVVVTSGGDIGVAGKTDSLTLLNVD